MKGGEEEGNRYLTTVHSSNDFDKGEGKRVGCLTTLYRTTTMPLREGTGVERLSYRRTTIPGKGVEGEA